MYGKDKIKELRIEFWGKLEGQMNKMRNPNGSKVNWMSYRTNIKHLYFRMEADEAGARLCIDLQFPDQGIREVYYDQFLEFQGILESNFKTLKWHKNWDHWNGKEISRIVIEQEGTDLRKQDDWDKMQLFLKLNFAKLDKFWVEFGEVFKSLK